MTITETEFCNATSVWNSGEYGDDVSWACEPEDVVRTAETIDDFKSARSGTADEYDTPKGTLYVWENQQSSKGKRRGNIYLLDGIDFRFTYFDGEV